MVVFVAFGIFLYLSVSLDMGPHHELTVKSLGADVTAEYLLRWPLLHLLLVILILERGHRLGSRLGGPRCFRLLLLEVDHTLPLGSAGLGDTVSVAAPGTPCGLRV